MINTVTLSNKLTTLSFNPVGVSDVKKQLDRALSILNRAGYPIAIRVSGHPCFTSYVQGLCPEAVEYNPDLNDRRLINRRNSQRNYETSDRRGA